jgi:uncharacterized protein (TIGR03067 family)
MRLSCVCLLAVGVVLPALAAEPDPAAKDRKALQGEWAVEALEYNGKDLKDKYNLSFACKSDVLTVQGDGAVRKEYAKLAFKLDPSTTPKCVDLTVAGGVQKDAKLEGIYELKGDELRLCVKVFGSDRPTEFKSAEGASIALLTLKRKK